MKGQPVYKPTILSEKKPLMLPDGSRADALRVAELHRALAAIGVPGISPAMGKPALLAAYEAAMLAKQEAELRAERDGRLAGGAA